MGIIIKRVQQRPSVLRAVAAHELILPDAVVDEKFVSLLFFTDNFLR